jgi:FtsP/CotA-like multicopper oxidase with cupredoxin domain
VRAKNHVESLTLHAVNDNGRDAFAFDGANVAPVIRASPRRRSQNHLVNDLPVKSSETCAVSPYMNMTNLHFHGLSVSPHAPQDHVLTMLAKPGQALHYSVQIPRDHPLGLFWYHTHPNGESDRQMLDGMSGAIVIEGMKRYAPQVRQLRERVIVVRGRSIESDPNASELRREVEIPFKGCGRAAEGVEEIFTVNGAVRPRIEGFTVTFTEDKNGFYINGRKFVPDASPMTSVRVGTYQHWRIVNETAELHPFHIHQVQLPGLRRKRVPLSHPAWLDTVNVPYRGTVDVILDFTNPVIKGMSVFHCHLLNHEDTGMMAKILFTK